jgi:hypothetical protein
MFWIVKLMGELLAVRVLSLFLYAEATYSSWGHFLQGMFGSVEDRDQ